VAAGEARVARRCRRFELIEVEIKHAVSLAIDKSGNALSRKSRMQTYPGSGLLMIYGARIEQLGPD